jgi:hypothetical protein
MGADVSRIFALEGAVSFDDAGLLLVESAILEHNPVLIIVDPLIAYIGAKVDLHRANETRSVMAALARIADRYGCAVLGIRHLTKGGKDRAIYRGIGSIDFTAACRSVLLVGCNPDDPSQRAVVQIKNNLAPLGAAVGYEIQDGVFFWKGGNCGLTAEKILGAGSGEERSSLRDAEEFLEEVLSEGPRLATEIKKEARAAGISERTLWRAKSTLRVKAQKQKGKGQPWHWELTDNPSDNDQTADESKDCQEGEVGSLSSNEDSKQFSSQQIDKDCQDSLFGSLSDVVGNLPGEDEDEEWEEI